MNKTRVDDLLIEMISPKIQEIEEKFSRGVGLTQDDINTLLLKSQYNHINHLDDRLNDVTASVQALELKFSSLETKFAGLETKFEQSMVKMQETIISTMRWYIGGTGIILVVLKSLDLFVK
jgi:ABC-type phosphate transport system auxiliary subunit